MKCPNCGAQLRGEICEYCGSAVEKPKAENEQRVRRARLYRQLNIYFCDGNNGFIIVLRQFNRISSFGDFSPHLADAYVSLIFWVLACGVSPTDAGVCPFSRERL